MDYRENDDINLKDIIAFYNGLKSIAFNNKYKIIVFAILFSTFLIGINFLIPIKYKAEAKLYLKEGASSNKLLSGIVGNITGGSNMIASIGEDAFINIAITKEVLKKTLVKVEKFRGEEDYLNNHLIKYFDWGEKWTENKKLQGFKFINSKPDSFTFLEDSIFNCIYYNLSEQISVKSEKGGIVNVSVVLSNDTLAKLINLNWVNEMIIFFKEKSGASLLSDIQFQTRSIDSLQKQITENEVALTQLKDEHNAIVKAKAYLDEIRLKRQIEINTVLLGEMIKNHEMSKYSYMTQKPIVEIVEMPRLPLNKTNASIILVGFFSVFVSFVLSLIIYVIYPYIKLTYLV